MLVLRPNKGGAAAPSAVLILLLSLATLALSLAGFASGAHAETLVQRGAYLVRGIAGCGNCHTPKDEAGQPIAGMELAGGLEIDLPGMKTIVPNITPDKATGIGSWSEAQIVAAIRDGKRPDGSLIGPPMPIGWYRGISDRDVHAIAAYLRSLKPVSHKLAKSVYEIPLPPAYGPPVIHVAAATRQDKIAYGRYLATSLGHCMECHTPRLPNGRLELSRLGAGGQMLPVFGPGGGTIVSANLTPGPKDGIGAWSDRDIKTAIVEGVRPDGSRLAPLMAFSWYKHIKNADLDAIVAYLRSLKPQS